MAPRSLRSSLTVLALAVAVALAWWGATPAWAQIPVDEFINACLRSPENPYVATTRYAMGGTHDRDPAVVALRNTPNNAAQVTLATAGQVGAAYGLAYHGGSTTLYVAAFHKRGTHFGPAGTGGIYAIDLRSGAVRTVLTVPNAGADTHDPVGDFFPDISARFPAGKTSLGDIELSEDGSELFVVNLNDRRIYRYHMPDGDLIGSFDHGAAGHYWKSDARPFGLGVRDGKVYHGVVRTAESSQLYREVTAYVYESQPDGSDMRQVAIAPLRFDRGSLWPGEGPAAWNPWRDPPGQIVPDRGRYPQPILADIAFTDAGDQMILGFRDRFGDTTFYTTPPNQPPPGEEIFNTPGGDILPAFPDGQGGWTIRTTPEYYVGDAGPQRTGGHDETCFGGVALLPGTRRVAMSANSPLVISSAGVVWLDVDSGEDVGREQVYRFGVGHNFGKSNGLGDLEVLCGPVSEETATATVTTVASATATETEAPTLTATATFTPTETATLTLTATQPVTPTVTTTATAVDTVTPTLTVTATETTGPSATVVETSTPTETGAPTSTAPPDTAVPEDTPVPPTATPVPPTTSPPEEEEEEEAQPTPVPAEQPPTEMPKTGVPLPADLAGTGSLLAGTVLALLGVATRRRRQRG